ncbi:hypothetical protein ACE41H_06165 [Paenibacillus enshidis]|uniref:DUF5071 domain-containing protein n=1 Tax=Paenibacillus enshidis TaxID=1458439 RepID=A0ABV5AQ89_9BACL
MSEVLLSIPVGLLIENCRSSGAPDEEIIACMRKRDFSPLLDLVRDQSMDFIERLDTAAELGEDWEQAIRSGYAFKFLHINAVKRLLLFRFNKREDVDYIQAGYKLIHLKLSDSEIKEMESLIHRQWIVEKQKQGSQTDEATVKIFLKYTDPAG